MKVNNLAPQSYEFGSFRLIPDEHLLLCNSDPVPLSPKVFEILVCLVESEGHLIKKSDLLDRLWPSSFIEEATLARSISSLRKALGETAENKFIETVPKHGYRFVAPVKKSCGNDKKPAPQFFSDEIEEESEPQINPNGNLPADLLTLERSWQRPRIVEQRSNGGRLLPTGAKPGTGTNKPPYQFLLLSGSLILLAFIGWFGLRYYNSAQSDQKRAAPFAGAQVKQLTSKGRVSNAIISPDGKFYAYTLLERGEYKNSLWLAQTDGSSEIQLRPLDDNSVIRGLAFSPDGKTLYFSQTGEGSSQAALYKMPIIGGVVEKLSDNVGNWFALSPNGERVAFFRSSRLKNASVALVSVNLDGSDEREITTRPRDKDFSPFAPAWSPDGSMIAFGAGNEANHGHEVFTIRVADAQIQQLTSLEWFEIANLIWRQDGDGLIVSAIGKREPKLRHLWHVDYPAGAASKLLLDTDSYAHSLSTTSDGSNLLAVKLHRESNIWVAPSDDISQARQITFSAINGFYGWHGFDWTADGRIVFSAGVDSGLSLNVMSSVGDDIKQITSAGFFDQRPSVSKDGRYIFFRSNRSGGPEIWRVNADGGDLKQLTAKGGSISAPHVSPDSKWVVYTSAREGRIFLSRISVEGGESIQITGPATAVDPRVSPDGRLVAFGYKANDKSPTQIAIVSIDGGEPLALFGVPPTANFNQSLRWTPDGSAICYRDWANGIWRQNLSGGPPERLEGLPEEKFYNFGWSPDGKLFAFTRGREIRDAVLFVNPAVKLPVR